MGREVGDVRASKAANAEFSKRGVDMTQADVQVLHGVMRIRGTVRPVRGSTIRDIKSEMEIIARVLRHKPEIKDVILECFYRD